MHRESFSNKNTEKFIFSPNERGTGEIYCTELFMNEKKRRVGRSDG